MRLTLDLRGGHEIWAICSQKLRLTCPQCRLCLWASFPLGNHSTLFILSEFFANRIMSKRSETWFQVSFCKMYILTAAVGRVKIRDNCLCSSNLKIVGHFVGCGTPWCCCAAAVRWLSDNGLCPPAISFPLAPATDTLHKIAASAARFSCFFFRTFGCEFDCRLLLGVVSCVMGAIKRSKTWTAQTQNYGTIRRGRKSHKRWLHKRTQFNPKSKNCTYILYVSLLKTIKKLTSHPLAGHSYPLSWCPRRREQVLFARAYRSLPVANITMAVTYIAGIVYFIS